MERMGWEKKTTKAWEEWIHQSVGYIVGFHLRVANNLYVTLMCVCCGVKSCSNTCNHIEILLMNKNIALVSSLSCNIIPNSI